MAQPPWSMSVAMLFVQATVSLVCLKQLLLWPLYREYIERKRWEGIAKERDD